MEFLAYFGTDGIVTGHYLHILESEKPVSAEDNRRLAYEIDGNPYLMANLPYKTPALLHRNGMTYYGVTRSPDDKRAGCLTVLIWEGEHNESEVLQKISEYALTKEQFNKLNP